MIVTKGYGGNRLVTNGYGSSDGQGQEVHLPRPRRPRQQKVVHTHAPQRWYRK